MIPLESFAANAIEATVLALIVIAVSRTVSLSPPLRSALWLLVLAKLLLPPVPILPAGLSALCRAGRDAARSALEAPPRAAPAVDEAPARAPEPLPLPGVPAASLPGHRGLPLEPVAPEDAWDEKLALEEAEAAPALPSATGASPSLEVALAIIWILGLVLLAGSRMRRVDALRALLRDAREADPRVAAECASLAAALGIRRPPRVRVADAPISPFLWTCGRPEIVLPAALVSPGREDLLRTVLAHELAHLARGDHFTAWIEVAATLGYWWLPTAWLAARAHERAADEAADALAAALVSTPRAYARSLLSTIELIHMTPLPAAFPGRSLGERDAVRRRLTMLFRRCPATRLSWTARLALIAAAALALPASPRPLSSQEAADEPAAAEPLAPTAGAAVYGEEATAPHSPPADAPSIPPVTPVRASNPVVAPAAGAPVIVSTPHERGPSPPGAEPADGHAIDVEHRLRRMEERIDALLRELQLIRSQMSPGATAARSRRAATTVAPAKARTSIAGAGTTGVSPNRSASSDAAPGATPRPAGASLAPSAPGGMPGAAPAADPSRDWLSPPPDDLTEEQRARVEELDRQYRERLLKHKLRYAREREEAIRLIREGKDPSAKEALESR